MAVFFVGQRGKEAFGMKLFYTREGIRIAKFSMPSLWNYLARIVKEYFKNKIYEGFK
jgi:hypothetical protein